MLAVVDALSGGIDTLQPGNFIFFSSTLYGYFYIFGVKASDAGVSMPSRQMIFSNAVRAAAVLAAMNAGHQVNANVLLASAALGVLIGPVSLSSAYKPGYKDLQEHQFTRRWLMHTLVVTLKTAVIGLILGVALRFTWVRTHVDDAFQFARRLSLSASASLAEPHLVVKSTVFIIAVAVGSAKVARALGARQWIAALGPLCLTVAATCFFTICANITVFTPENWKLAGAGGLGAYLFSYSMALHWAHTDLEAHGKTAQ